MNQAIEIMDREARPAYIRFERKPIENKEKSLKAGRTVFDDIDIVFVTPPYSRDCFEDKASNWLKKQEQLVKKGTVPQKFLDYWNECYSKWKIGQEAPINGTDIRNWAAVTPAQVKNMQSIGVRTIEDMAACNAEGLSRLGMGAVDLKNKAQAWLKGADDRGSLVMENTQLKKDNERMKTEIESLNNKIRTLAYQLENAQSAVSNNNIHSNVIELEEIMEDEHESLVSRYKDKFGKEPHHRMKDETIRKELES